MFKINNLIIKLCIINISLLFSCSAAEQPKNRGVTQVDLEQLVKKGSTPNRQDSETAQQVLEDSRLQQSDQIKKEAKQIVGQAGEGLKKERAQLEKRTLSVNRGPNCTQCKNTLLPGTQSTPSKKDNHSPQDLIIFVSSSMPAASLKALFWQAQRAGVPLVFRGLIDNSFEKTKSFFEEQQMNGEVDPTLFETYKISEVPTFVLRQGQAFDTVQGNISLQEALTLFKNKGDLKQQAGKLLASMKASRS